MKTLKRSITATLLLFCIFAISPAMAKLPSTDQTAGTDATAPVYGNTTVTTSDKLSNSSSASSLNAGGTPNGGVGQGNGNGNQDHFPINNGIAFLLAAGIAIGIKVITDRAKTLKLQQA